MSKAITGEMFNDDNPITGAMFNEEKPPTHILGEWPTYKGHVIYNTNHREDKALQLWLTKEEIEALLLYISKSFVGDTREIKLEAKLEKVLSKQDHE